MTLSEFIEKLQQIKDQDKVVYISGDTALKQLQWHDNVIDSPHRIVIRG